MYNVTKKMVTTMAISLLILGILVTRSFISKDTPTYLALLGLPYGYL